MTSEKEPRELTPVQMFWDGTNTPGFKDLSPHVVKVSDETVPVVIDEEVREAEEAMTPVPKDGSVPESVLSPVLTDPVVSETPALPQSVTPTPAPESPAVETANGKPSESSVDAPPTPSLPFPVPAPSSSSSSSTKNPGGSTPPAPVKPPTSG